VMQYVALFLRARVGKPANKIDDGDLQVCYTRMFSSLIKPLCQIRSSPICIVMNKLPSYPPVFILTPSQRPTLICIHTTNPITLLYSTII
jgi:hypothetical protein